MKRLLVFGGGGVAGVLSGAGIVLTSVVGAALIGMSVMAIVVNAWLFRVLVAGSVAVRGGRAIAIRGWRFIRSPVRRAVPASLRGKRLFGEIYVVISTRPLYRAECV